MHNAATLREHFPEFSDTTMYPDGSIDFWLSVADASLKEPLWAGLWDQGCELFAAHNIALGAMNQLTAESGGVPGTVKGPQTSKAVDKVSVSNDASAVTHMGAGHWNMTSYGIRFYQLARIVGAGGFQL
jgi:hypothetical protein